MGDLEKVKSYAQRCPNRPLRIRWEGAGNASHATQLLNGLYSAGIRFDAEVNIYEGCQSNQFVNAANSLREFLFDDNFHVELSSNVDLSRLHTSNSQMDFIFVRNIMPTSGGGDSQTQNHKQLSKLHQDAIRQRRHSLGPGGQLEIGMSGGPGLIGASGSTRQRHAKNNNPRLFNDSQRIIATASRRKLTRNEITQDRSVSLMKNDGSNLGPKPTFYLTFVRPISPTIPRMSRPSSVLTKRFRSEIDDEDKPVKKRPRI